MKLPSSLVSSRGVRALGVLLSAGLTSASLAQVVTPPPAKVDPVDWNIPKPPPEPPRPQVEFNPQNVQPVQPVQAARPEPLPNLPYESLAKPGPDGRIPRIDEPLAVAALRRNPMLQPGFVDSIQDLLTERRVSAQLLVVANLDIMEKIEDGLFEGMDFAKRETIRNVLDTVKPLTEPTKTLGEALEARGLIEKRQMNFNNRIASEYVRAVVREQAAASAPPAPEGEKPAAPNTMMQEVVALYKQNVDEFIVAHRQGLARAAADGPALIEGLSWDAATKQRAVELARQASSGATSFEKASAMKSLRDFTTLDQRRELLRAAFGLPK